MRLVWAVIPLVLILFTIGIVGVQESFATWSSQYIQTDGDVDIDGSWYLGEGLKEGDYFEYSLCEIDLNDCAPIQLKMWIKGEIPYESGSLWDTRVVIYDDNKIIKGSMGLGKSSPEPITFDDNIFHYAIAFKSSLAWLGIFATASEDLNHGPKQFSDKTWNTKWIPIGAIGGLYPLRAETITIPAGTFDTVVVGWESNNNNEIWVVDNFPFPVKALTYAWVTTGVAPIMHQYTLLDYQENIMSDPFKDVVVSEPPEKLLGCTTEFSDYVSGRVSPNTSSLLIQYDYSPEFPIEGCNIDWKINFINKYNDAELIDQIHYDIWVVDENGNKLRSYAQDLGRAELFNGFGQVHILFPVEEEAGIARYTIFVHGTGPEYEIPDPTLGGYATIEIEIKENPLIDESFAEQIPSPKYQLESGIAPENIICKEDRILVQRTNGNVACVTERTVERTGWEIIKVEFVKSKIILDVTFVEKSETIVLNVSSDVDYVDDERVYDIVGQRRPAPMPMYDKIIDYEINPNNIDSLGTVTLASISHEKYSLNPGVGLYIEDWMPTYIPDGYKLLYADTGYTNYDWVVNPHELHYVTFQFVPTDFVFYANVTNYELSHKSDGFTVTAKFDTAKFDEIEDAIEKLRDSRESQSGNYGEFRDMTRDGKVVYAYAGGNDLNPYSAVLSFAPDDYSRVHVNTHYLTLDELIPIFESIME